MYEIIPGKLASHGIGDNYLVQPKDEARHGDHITLNNREWRIVDARTISDEGTSPVRDYAYLIDIGEGLLEWIHTYELDMGVVVCCGAGQSRSNAIAIGILVEHFKMDFYDAYELIREKVPIQWILPDHITKLKKLFNVTVP